ncbi:universal stress protein [Natrialba sp. INN-245]|uniref:universal stress protein n=1 Tax=Natrialba sp. INN-245 TaxID=2690967 RepID=UPI001310C224|nr:universal stress protein [Natrialba sp. INN-245]MWV38278.1 universal stress protein [Natrialba sp. INN-245]
MVPTEHAGEPVRSILVPTDGSDAADAALERALTLAANVDATVHVLAVVDTTDDPLRFDSALVADLETAKNELVEDVLEAVDGRQADVVGAVRRGRPASTIVDYASEIDADLIVVGRTGESRTATALLGSTADRVVRTASIPVIVVPDPSTDTN